MFLRLEDDNSLKNRVIFILTLGAFWAMDYLFGYITSGTELNISLDYGIEGIILPLFAVMSRDKRNKLIIFTAGLAFVAERLYGFSTQFVFAMMPAVLLCFYNGKAGKKNLKYFFYLFYPTHLAVIYAVNMLINS